MEMNPFRISKKVKQAVYTIEECPKCGRKTKRKFRPGDYVYKEGELCDKCNVKMLITSIYAEVLT